MHTLSETDLLTALLALAIILLLARAMAEIARRVGQPEVLGELFAGFLLGPSVFGALAPNVYHSLFMGSSVGTVLSAFSWIGVILLLLMAGLEVDLNILRQHWRPGIFAAVMAIVPSLIAGSLFAAFVLGRTPPAGIFLGIVLSVTGVSVIAKILMERGAMRRGYAQVIVAAGVASEVVVWLFIAVVSSFHSSSPLVAGLLHTAYAIGFFVLAMTVGRRFVFWAMRRVQDTTGILRGPVSLVLVLTFAAAALTQVLGLHPLLGAFVVGVLLGRAPRANERMMDGVQALTLAVFGPIFFALAGMRVDILKLGSPSAIATVLGLLVVATAVKVGFTTLGARLGGTKGWEAAIVGVGVNLKGGTDVVVAIVGVELGLLKANTYTMYAVVAILTVLFSPFLISWLEGRVPPSQEEQERLDTEEAVNRSYVPKIERVLVPLSKELRGTLAASVVQSVARAKHEQGEIFDITQVEVRGGITSSGKAQEARDRLDDAGSLQTVELTAHSVDVNDVLDNILNVSQDYDVVAIGAHPPERGKPLTFGRLQDRIIDESHADVLLAINHTSDNFDAGEVHRILVPTNGLEYSMAAGDIAAAIAHVSHASVTLMHVVHPVDDAGIADTKGEQTKESAVGLLDELEFRLRRLDVRVKKCLEVGEDSGRQIVEELGRGSYDLVVLGGIDRGHDGRVYLGHTIHSVLTGTETPAIMLVAHDHGGSS